MDCGDNKMFLKLDSLNQNYVTRLKSNRKLLYHNKGTFATELRNRRKGKIKISVFYIRKNHEAYISHVKVQITASRKDIYWRLVWHHRASNDACHKIEKSSQRGCCQSGKNLFLTMENQGILPLQKADVPI